MNQHIGLGQSVTIDAPAGRLDPAQGAVSRGPITVYSNVSKMSFFALLYCAGPRDTIAPAPIDISTPIQAGSKVEFTPVETAAVWFAANYATSTIISNAINKTYKEKYFNGATAYTIS